MSVKTLTEATGMKKLSKVFLSVITLGAVACSSGAFAACGGNTPAEHTHNWGGWTEKAAANCTAAKVEERNCLDESCPGNGHEERSVGEPLGHAFGDWDFTPPSLEAAGGADKTCTRDGCTGTLHVDLPKLGGEGYVKGEDSATCAGGGMQKYTFKHSEGDIVFNVATPAKAHTFGNWTVLSAPTDKDTGFARAVCSGDGCKQTKLEMLPVLTDESIESGYYTKRRVEATGAARGKWVYTVTKPVADEKFGGVQLEADLVDLPLLVYGDNTVELTAYENQVCEFVSETEQTYSITVPEGVIVNLDDEDIITGTGTYANFDAPAGEKIKFYITSDVSGTVTVVIGDAIDETVKIKNEETKELNLPANGGNSENMFVLTADDGIAEGKYTFSITSVGTTPFCYFAVAGADETLTFDELKSSKGVMFIGSESAVKETAKYTCSKLNNFNQIAITVNVKAGDKIYFATNSGTGAILEVSMRKV